MGKCTGSIVDTHDEQSFLKSNQDELFLNKSKSDLILYKLK